MTDVEGLAAMAKGLAFVLVIMFCINVITVITIFVRKETKLLAVCSAVLYFYATCNLVLFFVVWQVLNLYGYTEHLLNKVSYSNLNEQMFGALRISSYECRVKFICETSRLITSNNDALASFLRFVHVTFGGFDGDYISGALEGLTGSDCANVYTRCNYSPLRKTFPFLLEEE
ncbi:hypothetical protein BIW11_11149 [Tropilaelaps mercedesae]|uniref:Uncharacterized protein n=1 Tax=Tropilaelaps mercedesae TaxID=418985 RepID=A0A1V9XCE5_9ACAR|nr:hypothetical protein BIW11_11149 [Tropilaelaps mercedesae]